MGKRRKERPKPRLGRGARVLAWLAVLGASASALWLLGYPTVPGPYAPTPAYGGTLAALAAGACAAGWGAARGDAEGLRAWLRRRGALLLALGGILAALLLGEGLARAFRLAEWGGGQGPLQPHWRLRNYRINARGLRGPLLTPEQAAGRAVVLGLGDSFTFGQGVAWEDTFLQRIERALAPEVPGGLVTVSMAKPGWSTLQEYAVLREHGWRYRPKVLLVQFTLNDAEEEPYFILPEQPWWPLSLNVLWRSHLYFSLVKVWTFWRRPYGEFIRGLYRDDAPGYVKFRLALRRMAAEARERGAVPVLVLFPMLQDLDRYEFGAIHEKVAALGREAGFEVVDLLEAYRRHPEPTKSLRVSRGDWHPNAEGHRIAAEALVPVVRAALGR